MRTVKLMKAAGQWVTEWMGRLHHFHFDHDLVEWVALGVHPDGAVSIPTDLSGVVETIKIATTGSDVLELEIPPRHALSTSVIVGRPYREPISV